MALGMVCALAGAAVYVVCLLAGGFDPLAGRRAAPEISPEGEARDWSRVIAYVPLDDRTDNLESTILLAEASGWELLLPDRDLFRTALDGQPRNANGTAYGDREALFLWIRELEARGCNRYVLSLDQLFSGGLVNSRSLSAPTPLRFPDGTVMEEAEAFDAYILPLAADPVNRVYVFDSVARLSPTVGYLGVGETEYYGLRAYGMAARPELPEGEPTLEDVFSRYPYAADGGTHAEDAPGSARYREILTEDRIAEYLGVRRRKLTLLDKVLDSVLTVSEDGGNFQLLIGVDDSSNAENIQYNELRYIRSRLGPGTAVMPGLDSLARLLIGRLAQEEYDYKVKTSVRYVRAMGGQP